MSKFYINNDSNAKIEKEIGDVKKINLITLNFGVCKRKGIEINMIFRRMMI